MYMTQKCASPYRTTLPSYCDMCRGVNNWKSRQLDRSPSYRSYIPEQLKQRPSRSTETPTVPIPSFNPFAGICQSLLFTTLQLCIASVVRPNAKKKKKTLNRTLASSLMLGPRQGYYQRLVSTQCQHQHLAYLSTFASNIMFVIALFSFFFALDLRAKLLFLNILKLF